MIRNVIFDFGQVMVRFDPIYITSRKISDPSDVSLVAEVLFDRLYWDALDAGTISDEEVIAAVQARLPERLHAATAAAYADWMLALPEIEGMRELVRDCRERLGARVFLLSNISKGFAARAAEIPVLAEFEDCVFSSVCGAVKPDAAIFRYLCEKNDLLPAESLFVDDNPANVAGAEAFGLHAYLFDGDVSKLKQFLAEMPGCAK